jgi:hypothetical protein
VFHQEHTAPEEVDKAIGTGKAADRLLEGGERTTAQTEDGKELIPEGLGLGIFAVLFGLLARKTYGILTDFVPTDRHNGPLRA